MEEPWKQAAIGAWAISVVLVLLNIIMIRIIVKLEYRISRLGG